MKFRLLVLLVLATTAVGATPRERYEAGILKLIGKCKSGDVQSLPIRLPALGPMSIQSMTFSRSDFRVSFGDLTINGFQNMRVQGLLADPERHTMSIYFVVPKLTIYADWYSLQTVQTLYTYFSAVSVAVTFAGNRFTCEFTNLNVQADVAFGSNGPDTVITNLRMRYTGAVQVDFSGSEYYVNEQANARISEMMRDPTAVGNVENLVKERANQYLRGHTPEQFVQIISDYSDQ